MTPPLRFGSAAAIVLAVLAGAVAALGAKPAARAPEPTHVLLVPVTEDGAAAIVKAKARVVATYPAFTLVESTPDGIAALEDAGAQQRDDLRTIELQGRRVDPLRARPKLTGAVASSMGAGLAVVQFIGPVKDEWLQDVRLTGVKPITYMANDAFLVVGTAQEMKALAERGDRGGAVRAVVPYTALDKARDGLPSGQTRVQVGIQTVAGQSGEQVRREIAAKGRRLSGDVEVRQFHTQYVELSATDVRAFADRPEVIAVEPWAERRLLDERAAQVVAGSLNGTGTSPVNPGYLTFLSNNGFSGTLPFAIDVSDEGVDKGVLPPPAGAHPDFFVSGSTSNPSRIVYNQESTADADARDCGGHGTNVASIAAGYNNGSGGQFEDGPGFNYGLGIAPRAKIGNTKVFNCAGSFDVGGALPSMVSNAFTQGARVSNNSWGANVAGAYDSFAQLYDGFVRDAQPGTAGNQELIEVFSAGNAGSGSQTIGSPGSAKNVITVGASESSRQVGFTDGCGVTDADSNNAKDIIGFSSRGPTADGRLKPDIVAPGTHIVGAAPQTGADYNGSGTCNSGFILGPGSVPFYSLVSGTSQAAPEVTGAAANARDWYRRAVGGGTALPSPAMVKAMLVNGADDLAGGSDGAGGTNAPVPTQTQGWGRANLGRTMDDTSRDYLDQRVLLASTGTSRNRTYTVDDPSKPVRVTMVYTDVPGPTTGAATVNDVDLEVVANGTIYRGNVFSGGQSVPGGSSDPRNTVENVYLPSLTGRFTVTVRGTNIVGDGYPGNGDTTDQDYALVVSNAIYTPAPVLTTAGDATVSGGDGNSWVNPGESVNLRVPLRNTGDGGATGISTVLTAPASHATVTQPNSGYPNLAAGASALNTTPFAFTAGSVACGTTLRFGLEVTSAQGVQSVPVAVTTGQPVTGTPNSADVPKAIADNSTTNSTVWTGNNKITDLNVRLSLTHTFDGDLEIDLISPDGTTVRLFTRRGGGGDNLTNTVLDDQAATGIAVGTAPFTGSFRPEEPLAVYNGKMSGGTWTLRIRDMASGDTGTLTSWGMSRGFRLC